MYARRLAALLGLAALPLLTVADMRHEYLTTRDRRALASGIVYDGQIASSYDHVIIGGGLAGLVLASRLSEDSNTTVLVLESGDTGDLVRSQIDVPGEAYYSSLLGTTYDWQYMTVPQPNVGNRALSWPRGRLLGGCTAVNGLYMVRPSALEFNVWAQLQSGAAGADDWAWGSMFAAMKKSENFTAPSAEVQQAGAIEYNVQSHGSSGPLHTSFPGFIVPAVGNWTETLDWIGVNPSADPDGGQGWGAFIATSSINPDNLTRSYSRSAYIDNLPPRPNLAILPNATVTRLILAQNGSSVRATQVEYAAYDGAPKLTVGVNKEAILAGGAVGSPHVLMHSGIGPQSILQPLGISTYVNLPGVGQNLQDHLSGEVVFSTTAETAAQLHGSEGANGTSAFMSFINSAIAYPNITDLLGDYATTYQSDLLNNLTWAAANLVPSTDPTIIAGYKAIYQSQANTILPSQVGQVELLFGLTGTSFGTNTFSVQAALQHPYSRGQLYINSSNPFDHPVIDPGYLTHPADIILMREGLKLARTIGQTYPLNGIVTGELSPGNSTVSTDAEWDAWIPGVVGTEYHPSCSCSMLPLSEGGVVDPQLRVYGTSNVRVVDSSVFPVEFAAHLMAPTYGLAEQAATMIRQFWNEGYVPTNGTTTASAGFPSQTGSGSSNSSGTGGAKSAALPTVEGKSAGLLAGVVALAVLLAL
ncbi:GMC oxidoreductase [Dacryopinax primogenitus]|uniref:GMC oxidoreductase n=1 Tax=Dacryopinax primogenitus (strain DJM 731) TaxID=1858805 RepID=M5GF54_DACPD|nr:GMC oxidoreductase [Dacryopinax primogenitus]EJU03853.1 GMC oxidoreductase [Dacryopinax primogenitus]